MDEIAIKIDNVSKEYRLGAIGGGTLKGDLQSLWARIRKKEDPNSKIGSDTNIKIGERFLALDGISFEVKKGEAVGIIGHNGAGKSTLLKLLSRVTAPTKGTIGYNGRIASMLEVGTGFHPELTGRENVYMNGAILGMTKAEIDKKFDEIVEFAEMKQFIDTPVKRYSSGMYVKLAFSVAAHLDAEIMIMDEVLAVGDMAFQKKCLSKMKEAANIDGRTVLYVSHNMNTIRTLCDRCIVLDKGKVIFEGNVDEAIAIYLNNVDEGGKPFVDLTMRERPGNSTNKAFINNFCFVDKIDCVYKRTDIMRFSINWKAIEDLEDVKYRMIVRFADDTPVGLVKSDSIGSVKSGNVTDTYFEFDTSLFAEGRYFLSIALFQNDEIGNSIILDHITRACSFEIIHKDGDNNKLNWEHRYWGSINFPELKIINF